MTSLPPVERRLYYPQEVDALRASAGTNGHRPANQNVRYWEVGNAHRCKNI
jgi:hypothetical protein